MQLRDEQIAIGYQATSPEINTEGLALKLCAREVYVHGGLQHSIKE